MQQTLTLKRTETKIIVLDVVQPLAKATLGLIANGQALGIGTPGPQAQISHSIGAWEVTRVSPECECAGAQAKAKLKPKR